MSAKRIADAFEILEGVTENNPCISIITMSFDVSSSESLSLTITGDSTSLFRKAYWSPKGKGLSSIRSCVGVSNSRSSRTSSKSSSS
jgi:hypothetical protein